MIDVSSLKPLDVWGARSPSLNKYSGIPVLLDDPIDKVTRYYIRYAKTNIGDIPSFVYAVASAYRSEKGSRHPSRADLYDPSFIWFTLREGNIAIVSAATALEAASNTLSVLKDRIVILGGTYRDYDRHFTPIGTQSGVIVLANALQTELFGPSVKAPSQWKLFIVEAIAATLLVLGLHVFELSHSLVILAGLVLAVILTLAFNFLIGGSLSGFLAFAPTLLAVLLFEIYEDVRY